MIRLRRSMLDGLNQPTPTLPAVRKALQSAVELEHATIPVYLYGLYSLDASKNAAIVRIIQSVVVEEMLHMTLASNVLNALGGSPVIDSPGFIPTFPGPLPGGVESDLTVNLAPFSMQQLQTYLQIEQPEHPIDIDADATATDDSPVTIGEFYTALSEAIECLGDSVFVDPPRNQVGPTLMGGSVVVTNVKSAQCAIRTIIRQGEGSTKSPEDPDGEPAHYYRFMQIQNGALLVSAPGSSPPWEYSGAAVDFDATGVYAVATNPALSPGYAAGSVQAFANDNFNYTYTYTSLLHSLTEHHFSQCRELALLVLFAPDFSG
jgi:Ferritin-like